MIVAGTTELTEAQTRALAALRSDRWEMIGTAELPRPTINALARDGLVLLGDKMKRELDPRTGTAWAQYAKTTEAGDRAKKNPRRKKR